MFLRVHPQNPDERKIKQIVECLQNGGIIIYPTDTVYGIGCDIHNAKAIEKLYQLKGVNAKTAQFSFICNSISELSTYAKNIDTPLFKILKKCLPGPYTFIFEASKEVPKLLKTKKNTVGLRMPQNAICQEITKLLGHPIISTSLPTAGNVEDYTDPEIFYYLFENKVDIVIEGGIGNALASTVVDCSSNEIKIIRQGAGTSSIFTH